MAWWDNGIHGKNGGSLLSSGGVSYPVSGLANIDSYIGCGSVSYNASPEEGQTFPFLLCTTEGGTQIFMDVIATRSSGTVYVPEEVVNLWYYQHRIRLRKSGTEWYTDILYGGACSTFIAGEGSIYNYNYRRDSGHINSPLSAYPRSGRSGGTTNQIGLVSGSDGLRFYAIGFRYESDGGTVWDAPGTLIGVIPASMLSNAFWFDSETDAVTPEEYEEIQGGNDIIGDPEIDYQYRGDDIGFPELPSGASAIGFGRMQIYHPTASQLASALDILWSDSTETTLETILESLKKWVYKPEQYCVSLMIMPVNISGATNQKIYFGKYDTGVVAPCIGSQWAIVDCGSLTVPLKSGSAFDYSPYVKAMIYLPYVGFRSINVNEIMNGTVSIKYYIDLFTGSALCMVRVGNSISNNSVMYTYECNIAQQIPITSNNYNNVINSLISASIAVATKNTAAIVGSGIKGAAETFSPDMQTSGQLNPNTGALGSEKPYIALHFPVQSVPAGYMNQWGYPSSVNIQLGNISGYTEVEKIHLNIPDAYEEDLNEIERLLSEGVIL